MLRALPLLAVLLLAGCLAAPDIEVPPLDLEMSSMDPDCFRLAHGIDLQSATIPDLQVALAAGEVNSVQLVEAYLARIAAYDAAGPKLNSVRALHPEALAQAAALDAERAAGKVRGPLHGIPILLKDNVNTNDMPTTAGSIALADNVPPVDATLTARLREAGAIVLGKAQLTEFANWVSTRMPSGYSSLGGQVLNAYHFGDPSGSSAGSGVAASMAFASGTIGTETLGSILSPSVANSLVGVKPTTGLVSRAGVIPIAESFDTPGPMTRNVVDAALILGAVAGPDQRDPRSAQAPAGEDYAAGLSPDALVGVRLGYEESFDSPLFRAALADLERLGATLVSVRIDPLDAAGLTEAPTLYNEFKEGINRYLAEEAGPGLPVSDLTSLILYNQQYPDKMKYGQDRLILSEATPGQGAVSVATSPQVIAANRALVDGLLARDDLDALVGENAPYTALGAAAGYPTVVVPSGYDQGWPEALSFFGPAFSEARLLAYAYAYEQATMHRVPPSVINADLVGAACDGTTPPPTPSPIPTRPRLPLPTLPRAN